MNINQRGVELSPWEWLADFFVTQKVQPVEKEPWCFDVSGAWSIVLALDNEWEDNISGGGAQLLREVCLEGAQMTEK